MNEYNEAEVIINGTDMGPGCAMTIRVAIETYANYLRENGLGDDEHGKAMVKNYMNRINDIRKAMRVIE